MRTLDVGLRRETKQGGREERCSRNDLMLLEWFKNVR